MKATLALLALLALATLSYQKTNNFMDYSDPGTTSCLCDLTKGACDSNCCCDSDCDPAIIAAWKTNSEAYCKDFHRATLTYLPSCDSLNTVDLRNTYYKPLSDALFRTLCIYYDRSPADFGYFYSETLSLAAEKEARLISSAISISKLNQLYWKAATSSYSYYEVNDPILVYSMTDAATVTLPSLFTYPVVEANGKCNYYKPALFTMGNSTITCNVTTSSTNCQWALLHSRIIKLGFLAGSDGKTKIVPTFNFYDYATGSQTTPSALASNCQSGSYVAAVKYTLTIKKERYEIEKAVVDIYFSSSTTAQWVTQQNSILYFVSGSTTLQGNPGYYSGSKLWVASQATVGMAVFPGVGISDIDGYCSDAKIYKQISFGADMVFSCVVNPATAGTLQSFCTSASPLNSLGSIQYVGAYGNANSNDGGDWVKIDSNGTLNGTYTDPTCSFPELISYEFLVYKAGYRLNPQSRIISARRVIRTGSWTSLANKMITVAVAFKDIWKGENEAGTRAKFYTKDGGRDLIYPFAK